MMNAFNLVVKINIVLTTEIQLVRWYNYNFTFVRCFVLKLNEGHGSLSVYSEGNLYGCRNFHFTVIVLIFINVYLKNSGVSSYDTYSCQ